MAETLLHCEIVTPEGPALVEEVQMVVVPGEEGGLGILPRHAPIVVRLQAGETRVHRQDGTWASLATSEGYFKMTRNRALVLVEGAVPAETIDAAAARAAAEDARARLAAADAGDASVDRFRAHRDLTRAENEQAIAERLAASRRI